MFRLCLLAWGAAAISTETLVDDVDATLRSALSHLREHLKVDIRAADAARLKEAPNLVKLLATARDDPETLAEQLAASPLAAVAREVAPPTRTKGGANALPIVTAHGMGDSCFNAGMKSVTEAAGKLQEDFQAFIKEHGGNVLGGKGQTAAPFPFDGHLIPRFPNSGLNTSWKGEPDEQEGAPWRHFTPMVAPF